MALHFSKDEFQTRIAAAIRLLNERNLDGLLMFQQESMYYLTGYDTFGFCFFQCLYLGADGRLALLTRSADLLQARLTSIIQDVRVWTDAAGAKPAAQLKDMLDSLGARGKRLGIETNSHGLTYFNGKAVFEGLAGLTQLEDASGLIDGLRAVKSDTELAYVREAGRLADLSLAAGVAETRAGADEGKILAAMQGAIFAEGGDYPANEFIIGSAEEALLVRYKSGRRQLSANDQLMLEFAGAYRRYHAAMMRTVLVGAPGERHKAMFAACREALIACEETLRPGKTAGDVFAAHASVMEKRGMGHLRLNACGYSLGGKFTPSWMDPPMFYQNNPFEIVSGMVMFLHMILLDGANKTAMALGRSYITTAGVPEPLSKAPLELIVR